VAAWLHLWTPPRDAVVPPVPWRRIAIGGGCVVLLLGAATAFALPRIEDSKESAREQEREEAARNAAAERRRVIRDQRPTLGTGQRPAGVSELRARRDLLATVEERITANARKRAAAGELRGRAKRTKCVPAPGSVERRGAEEVLSRRRDAYDCLAVTRDIPAGSSNRGGALGVPFRAVIDFERFSFAFCKTNPQPGERAVPDPSRVPLLPKACRGP
jgi:type II secretory pathway pseudopilin PulG